MHRHHEYRLRTGAPLAAHLIAVASLAATALPSARAQTGEPEINWTTTLKQSAAFRVQEADPVLVSGGSSAASNDGDRNFSKGLISNRTDLLSEADVRFGQFGLRVSGAAWFDPVYRRGNANGSPQTSQGPANQFPEATQHLHGRKAELLDAFVFSSFSLGGHSGDVRLGRHSMIYGESLFFGSNGIAYAMVPVDVIKATQVPGSQFRELIRPVNQISGRLSLSRALSVGAYYQFAWERTRLPAVGSYLSTSDALDVGGTQLMMVPPFSTPAFGYPGFVATRTADDTPGKGGQGGVQLRVSAPDIGTDFGLYAVRYHERAPQLVATDLAPTGLAAPRPTFLPSHYHLEYGRGVRAYGASFSKGMDEATVAGELSLRDGAYLVADPVAAYAGAVTPRGRSLHANLSTLMSFSPNVLAAESQMAAELACNRVLSVRNTGVLAANSTRSACAVRAAFEPRYRQVVPGLDVAVPVSASYTWGRSAAVRSFGPDRGGDISANVNLTYLERWRIGMGYTHFYGSANTPLDANGQFFTFKQSLADRDFVSVSLATTF